MITSHMHLKLGLDILEGPLEEQEFFESDENENVCYAVRLSDE